MIEQKNVKFPWTFLLITFGFTWLILLPGVLASFGLFELQLPMYALVAVAQFGPSLTAFFLTYRSDGKAGTIQLLKRAFNFHIPWKWLAAIFLIPPLLTGMALAIHVLFGGRLPELQLLSQPAAILPSFSIDRDPNCQRTLGRGVAVRRSEVSGERACGVFFQVQCRTLARSRVEARWQPLSSVALAPGVWMG